MTQAHAHKHCFHYALYFFTFFAIATARAEDTWVYAVEVSASAQNSGITLSWEPDPYGASSYTIYRKSKLENSWGTGVSLPGNATQFTDFNAGVGTAYEYQVYKQGAFPAYGYIYAGNQAPLIENRGKLILVVASYLSAPLASELSQLIMDLVGDGWQIVRHDVDTSASPASVRNLIIGSYNADPSQVNTVFLLGRIPIFHTGNMDYDGHGYRAMPADAFYGDVNGAWSSSLNFLPSDVELMVGRVDLAGMPGVGAARSWPNEIELTRNYLNKVHRWRHKLMTAPRYGLMGNRRGDEEGEATAATGYRTFGPSVGPNVVEANTADNAPLSQRWITYLANNSFLWAYGCGGGQPTKISGLGAHGLYDDVWSTDIVDQDAKAAFVLLFGSWFGNWDSSDNIMRSILAAPTLGLASAIAGRPHWFMHHMALGETIGFSARLSQNNSTSYRNRSNILTRAVFPALMGDPALRMDQVAPPSALSASVNGQTVSLSWGGSFDASSGYHVYRANSPFGPYTRRTASPISGTFFSEGGVPQGSYSYMVKAIKLESQFSGSYFNSSQGIFASITVQNAPQDHPPIIVHATRSGNGLTLRWNSLAGGRYKVQGRSFLLDPNWWDLTGPLTASGPETSWTESSLSASRFYRVVRLP